MNPTSRNLVCCPMGNTRPDRDAGAGSAAILAAFEINCRLEAGAPSTFDSDPTGLGKIASPPPPPRPARVYPVGAAGFDRAGVLHYLGGIRTMRIAIMGAGRGGG